MLTEKYTDLINSSETKHFIESVIRNQSNKKKLKA